MKSAELGRPACHRGRGAAALAFLSVVAGVGSVSCSSATGGGGASAAPLKPIAAAPPPKDDGKEAKGGAQGEVHSAALEQLRTAPIGNKTDKQNSIVVPLPDAPNWTRVRFMTLKSLVGFRYGKAHHAIVGGFITTVDDNMAEGACSKSFETWAMPLVEAFEVEIHHDPPTAFSWTVPVGGGAEAKGAPAAPKKIAILDVDPLFAKTATVLSHEAYAAAWTTYPAWDKACLVVGVAVPAREDEARAREVRDRFVKDVFPNVKITAPVEPKDRF